MRASSPLSFATLLGLAVLGPTTTTAQTFNSGSTGADGAFAPTESVRLDVPANGVFNFTTITIPAGVTVSFLTRVGLRQPPVSFLATGNVTINGRIELSGTPGGSGGSATQLFSNAGVAGPGGFDGGAGSNGLAGNTGGGGLGPGGGGPGGAFLPAHAGHLTAGSGAGGGRAYGDPRLVPLIGGSGGGGGGLPFFGVTATGGGGGGGAILIASSGTIAMNGVIAATGGVGGSGGFGGPQGGAGSGGAVRLVATAITGTGRIDVLGGPGASAGRIRLEAFTNTATLTGVATGALTLGAPDAVALDLIGLRIAAVAGVPAPLNPSGSFGAPDVILPAGTASPVTIALEARQIPLGTTVTVTATPLSGSPVSAVSTPLVGTPAAATATATLAVPTTQPSVISATASFTLATAP